MSTVRSTELKGEARILQNKTWKIKKEKEKKTLQRIANEKIQKNNYDKMNNNDNIDNNKNNNNNNVAKLLR